MLNDQRTSNRDEDSDEIEVRDIHALTPPPQPSVSNRGRRRESWETSSHRSSTLSDILNENFTTMSREFNAMVVAGSTIQNDSNDVANHGTNLARIGEDVPEEMNPLAIVPDHSPLDPVASPRRETEFSSTDNIVEDVSVHVVKKEEVESKIIAWQTAEIAKINNRFKREDVVIKGWEGEKVEKASTWLKKVERKLEEKRARAVEKMQNDVAKAHRKAEEKRASAEAKRGTKVARVLELSNLMRAVGRAPSKRSFF